MLAPLRMLIVVAALGLAALAAGCGDEDKTSGVCPSGHFQCATWGCCPHNTICGTGSNDCPDDACCN